MIIFISLKKGVSWHLLTEANQCGTAIFTPYNAHSLLTYIWNVCCKKSWYLCTYTLILPLECANCTRYYKSLFSYFLRWKINEIIGSRKSRISSQKFGHIWSKIYKGKSIPVFFSIILILISYICIIKFYYV